MTREEAIRELSDLKLACFDFFKKDAEALAMATEALEQLARKKGEKGQKGKKFIEIVVGYPGICPYPKYEGKPYFSIRYEENGEKFEGFGTYNPEVLSKYIREYFMGEKKGKWIEKGRKSYCSECGEVNFLKPNFCPNCGAKMEGDQ